MIRRLAKEIRPLLLPWCVAVVTGGLTPWRCLLNSSPADDLGSFLGGMASVACLGCLALVAAFPFGTEFQCRTLPLLLSQPVERFRIWNQKVLVAALVVGTVGLVHWLSYTSASLTLSRWGVPVAELSRLTAQQALLVSAFLVATVCSAGFWTLVARSTIGGLVFTVSSQLLLWVGVNTTMARIYRSEVSADFEDSRVTAAIVLASAVYSALFLWLGWRKFARWEAREAASGDRGPLLGEPAGGCPGLDWLRCRPTGSLANLARKELRLHKPVFIIAAVFSFCWLAILGLLFLDPGREEWLASLLNVLTAIYVPVLAVLAGCMSLGEEKALGLTAWQLTLPVSARRQWLVKLGVALGVGLVLGLVVPWLLAWVTDAKVRVGLVALIAEGDNGWQLVLFFSGMMLVLGFWAVTFVSNTVRAALVTMFGSIGLVFCVVSGIWCAKELGGLETVPLLWVAWLLHLPPPALFDAFSSGARPALVAAAGMLTLVVLGQSLGQFRRGQAQARALAGCSAVLAAITFAMAFWATDLAVSLNRSRQIGAYVRASIAAVPAR